MLEANGANPFLINTSKIPGNEELSARIEGGEPVLRVGEYVGSPSDVSSIWVRRISKQFVMPECSDEADHKHLRDNCRASLYGVIQMLDSRFPVNPLSSKMVRSLKANQLFNAQKSGFKIPKTLVSNNYDDIMQFRSSVAEMCVKSYYPQGWKLDEGDVRSATRKIESVGEYDRESFSIMPHIYQEFIDKKFEHRLTIFGRYHASIKIDMKELHGQSQVDWRSDLSYLSHVSPSKLPEEVVAAARKVLSSCGLRFGTFDIAETSSGEFVFFEVNEAGQWLWIETTCPEVKLLQPFCEFLTAADDDFDNSDSQNLCEFEAASVLDHIKSDDDYSEILSAEFPDTAVYLADERSLKS